MFWSRILFFDMPFNTVVLSFSVTWCRCLVLEKSQSDVFNSFLKKNKFIFVDKAKELSTGENSENKSWTVTKTSSYLRRRRSTVVPEFIRQMLRNELGENSARDVNSVTVAEYKPRTVYTRNVMILARRVHGVFSEDVRGTLCY